MSFRSLLLLHGYALLFFYVLGVQSGVPIPSDPLLLVMGALIRDGHYSFAPALFATLVAALIGDLFWFELGRWKGRSILALLCKLSLEPDTCVRKTEMGFSKRGAWTLLFTKFVPGMSLVSTPLAGAMHMRRWCFLLADAAGTAIWASAYLGAGVLFHRQIDRLIELLGFFGRRASLTVISLLALYVAYKFVQRWRFRRELRINRVTPHEALTLMNGKQAVTVVDLRSPVDIEASGFKILGALVLTPDALRSRSHEIPDEHEVILYCT